MLKLSFTGMHYRDCIISILYCWKTRARMSRNVCTDEIIVHCFIQNDCNKINSQDKKRGESGSPCLTPLLHKNCLPGTLLSKREEKPEVKTMSIHMSNLGPNPLAAKISLMVWCPIKSKAFSKCSFKIINSFLE